MSPLSLLAGLLVATPSLAENTILRTTNYYTVTGAPLAGIRHSLRESRPWRSQSTMEGLTVWQLEWRFVVTPSDEGCRCSSFSTAITITMTLPRWIARTHVSPEVKRAWERYISELGRHEDGHAQFALAAAAEQRKRIQKLGAERSCDILKNRIDDLARQVLKDYRTKEQAYDARTDHGAKQGAPFLNDARGPDRKPG